jgi:molybdate/tungstate transport system substrate-binding protein
LAAPFRVGIQFDEVCNVLKNIWRFGAYSCALSLALMACRVTAAPTTLKVYAAGTLAVPFDQVNKAFQRLHPDVAVEPQFGGSVMMARRITDLQQPADVYAAADYTVIPDILGKAGYASWFIGFASNAVTVAYTTRSRGAKQINADNWYRIVSRPGVVIGRSDPDTDPSGYQFLQMLSLASDYYHQPDLEQRVLGNSPQNAMRDTETSLISALQLGEIDYLAIYTSSAKSHHFEYLRLPADIDLSDPSRASLYAIGRAATVHGVRRGKPIVYAVTVPSSAEHRALALDYVRFLIGPEGRSILAQSGFEPLAQPWAHGGAAVPDVLRPGTKAWPPMAPATQ